MFWRRLIDRCRVAKIRPVLLNTWFVNPTSEQHVRCEPQVGIKCRLDPSHQFYFFHRQSAREVASEFAADAVLSTERTSELVGGIMYSGFKRTGDAL